MEMQHRADAQIKKLLLLGAGESGKSTLFKQMITIYGKGYSDEDRMSYRSVVHSNTLGAMKTLCIQSDDLGDPTCCVSESNQNAKRIILEAKADAPVDAEIAEHIKVLWEDPGIQATFDKRSNFQLPDSAQYFFERLCAFFSFFFFPLLQ
jgi:adenylate kinase family enzyme